MTYFSLLKTFNLQILQMTIQYMQPRIVYDSKSNKFQAIDMSCDKKENKYDLNTNNSIIISSVDSVTLLGIEIDNK